jgi:N-acetylglutamate synthase-like GNAT family acetyltransferase
MAADKAATLSPMQKKSFRRATASDAGTVRDITRAACAKQVAAIGREPKPMTANDEQAVLDHVIDLLEEDSQPIALIEIISSPSQLLIENITVLPDRHGEGIGGMLLEQAETVAQSLGVKRVARERVAIVYRCEVLHEPVVLCASRFSLNFRASRMSQAARSYHMKKSGEG